MYIDEKNGSILAKLCYEGPAGTGRAALLRVLHDHFAAQFGEHTEYDARRFEDRATLTEELGDDAADRFVAAAEQAFETTYDELCGDGTLVRMRTVLPPEGGSFQTRIDAFAATGETLDGPLRRYCRSGADAVVFVANAGDEDRASVRDAWVHLHESGFDGPLVLLARGTSDPFELVEALAFDGPAFAVDDDFAGNLEAFQSAAGLAVRAFRRLN